MAITIKKANMPKTDRGKENAPAAERRGATRERGTAIIAIAAIAAVSAAIGYTIHDACERRGISEAREACDSAIVELSGAANGYTSLLEADGTTAASQLEPNDVKDPKTIDSLKKAMLAGNPAAMKCDVSKAVELNSTAAKARKETETMKANTEALNTAVKAVESSKLDKTVDDASQLLNDSSGKVQDPKTRDELAKAIETRDSETIGKAMKTVGESMTAKKKADEEEARRKAEQEAAAQAEAQARAAQQTQRSHSNGWNDSTRSQSRAYSNNQNHPQQSQTNSGSPKPNWNTDSPAGGNHAITGGDNTDHCHCTPGAVCIGGTCNTCP